MRRQTKGVILHLICLSLIRTDSLQGLVFLTAQGTTQIPDSEAYCIANSFKKAKDAIKLVSWLLIGHAHLDKGSFFYPCPSDRMSLECVLQGNMSPRPCFTGPLVTWHFPEGVQGCKLWWQEPNGGDRFADATRVFLVAPACLGQKSLTRRCTKIPLFPKVGITVWVVKLLFNL